ncbi:MAG: hypothetical protein AAB074_22875 [Planctomycetota bacterium]
MSEAAPGPCPDCGPLGDDCEVQDLRDPAKEKSRPAAARHLRPVNELLVRSPGSKTRLFHCISCGCYFVWTTHSPGGSEDVFQTWTTETLKRVTKLAARLELEAELREERESRYHGADSPKMAAQFEEGVRRALEAMDRG